MQNLIISNIKILFFQPYMKQSVTCFNQYRCIISSVNKVQNKTQSIFQPGSSIENQKFNKILLMQPQSCKSLIFRSLSTESTLSEDKDGGKKVSKMKQLYSQYGPLFIVVHLITVVLWISGFFTISKQ